MQGTEEQPPSQPESAESGNSTNDAAEQTAEDWDAAFQDANGEPPVVEPQVIDRETLLSERTEARPDLEDTVFRPTGEQGDAAAEVDQPTGTSVTADEPPALVEPGRPERGDLSSLDVIDEHESADTRAYDSGALAAAAGTSAAAGAAASAAVAAPAPATGSIHVDEATARAAATGTPIVLVETPQPPKRRGARSVGFLVAILSTIVFGALLAGAILLIGFLFDRGFDLSDALVELWLQPTWLLPVVVFFVAYWLLTIIVNRAGWWAHVLGGFIVAVLTAAVAVIALRIEDAGGWSDWRDAFDGQPQSWVPFVLTPLVLATLVLAREVPIWLGGIVAKRGRIAKRRNAEEREAFERENEEKIAAYEASRA